MIKIPAGVDHPYEMYHDAGLTDGNHHDHLQHDRLFTHAGESR
jgi:hypothetical protein